MKYNEAKEHKEVLTRINKFFSDELKMFPTNQNGLVSEDIRNSIDYIEVKSQYDKSFINLQTFNSFFIKKFKKEYAADRVGRYKNKVKE